MIKQPMFECNNPDERKVSVRFNPIADRWVFLWTKKEEHKYTTTEVHLSTWAMAATLGCLQKIMESEMEFESKLEAIEVADIKKG